MLDVHYTGPTTDLHRVSAVISKVVSTYRQWTRGTEEISEGVGAASNRLSFLDYAGFSLDLDDNCQTPTDITSAFRHDLTCRTY